VNSHSHLIIGGTTKAGTTSLFRHLADHPEICRASIKETGFFLDEDYPLSVTYHYEDGLATYEAYFAHCGKGHVWMEATPDYLYSPGTPLNIKTALPKAKLVFILREPIERLISWYRFAKQSNRLSTNISFEEYVNMQVQNNGSTGSPPQHLRALEQGRYSNYLRPYFDLFVPDQLVVVKFSRLDRDPSSVLTEICRFAAIDPMFYRSYSFQIFNPTQTMKFTGLHKSYVKLVQKIHPKLYNRPKIHAFLRLIRRRVEPVYLNLNRTDNEQVVISESMRTWLEDYYRGESAALARLLGYNDFT